MADSIRVPGRVVHWIKPVFALGLSSGLFVLLAKMFGQALLIKFGIATIEQVGSAVGPVAVIAKAAQAEAFAVQQHVNALETNQEIIWYQFIALHAELETYRRFPNVSASRRGDLVDDAKRFYVKRFADAVWRIRREEGPRLDESHVCARAAKEVMLEWWTPH